MVLVMYGSFFLFPILVLLEFIFMLMCLESDPFFVFLGFLFFVGLFVCFGHGMFSFCSFFCGMAKF